MGIVGIVCIGYSITLGKVSSGLCIALHNDFGWTIKDAAFTTALSRKSHSTCISTNNKPCHVYLTLGEDST